MFSNAKLDYRATPTSWRNTSPGRLGRGSGRNNQPRAGRSTNPRRNSRMPKSLEELQNSLKAVKDGRERGHSWARSLSASEKLIRGSKDTDAACDNRVKAELVAKRLQSLTYASGDLSQQ